MSDEKLPPPVDTAPQPVLENTPLIGQQAPAGVVVMPPPSTQPVFKEFPVDMVDDKGNRFTTDIRYTNGLLTWVAVGITCLVAGAFGLPCIGLLPLCIKSFKDVEHINPNDGSVVGKFDRGSDLGLK
jgi:hypothetical protein